MHRAAKENNIDEIAGLLASGLAVDERDSLNRTALHLAAWRGNDVILEMLVRANADVLACAQDGYSALHFAVNSGNLAAVEALLKRRPKDQLRLKLSKNKKTALHLAAGKNNLAIVEALLARGSDPLALTKSGETPSDLATDSSVISAIISECQDGVAKKREDIMNISKRPLASSAPCSTFSGKVESGSSRVDVDSTTADGEESCPGPEVPGGETDDTPSNEAKLTIKPLKRKLKPLYAPPKIKLDHLGEFEE